MKTRTPKGKTTLAGQLKDIAKGVEGLTTMDEALEITRFVPTIFPSFNRASVLGGAPLGCIWTVHGDYASGKSSFCVGLIQSFIEQEHLAAFIDTECAASKKWFLQLGVDPHSFLFYQPDTFEDTVDMIDTLVKNFDTGRKDGSIPKDKGMIIVIDSVNKMTPAKELARFRKEGAEALDKGLARFRGLMLQSWLDRMTPIIGKRDIALVCIAQEREVKPEKKYDPTFKVKGCQGLMYDVSVQLRIMKGAQTWIEFGKGKVKKKRLVGGAHNMILFKNKIGFPMEFARFHTSNGKGYVPIGFNHAMTALAEDKYRGEQGHDRLITQSGAWYHYGDYKWHGEQAFIEALMADPDLLNDLQTELNVGITNLYVVQDE